MNHDNAATVMLGLDGVAVVAAQADEDGNPMLTLVTACLEARRCPGCGQREQGVRSGDHDSAGPATDRAADAAALDETPAGVPEPRLRPSIVHRVTAGDPRAITTDARHSSTEVRQCPS
ncbi:hypothetical protein [Actinomadura harenae]|uniref:hypothetical protein n=1 Tax=Actinomadura harenae TaxID=2483351 RepID=UPI0011C37CB5|nr:hypothetical protein [Actinomadura harenae]